MLIRSPFKSRLARIADEAIFVLLLYLIVSTEAAAAKAIFGLFGFTDVGISFSTAFVLGTPAVRTILATKALKTPEPISETPTLAQ